MNCNDCKNFEPKEPAVREVKRHAKPGEWIKIVREFCTGGHYKDGDILQCKHDRDDTSILAGRFVSPFIDDREYVVLEGYKPTPVKEQPQPAEPVTTYRGKQYREVKRKANVGELVKVTEECGGPVVTGTIWFVTRPCEDGRVYFKNDHDADKTANYGAYVVLEPIAPVKPTVRGVKRHAKPGEWIKINGSYCTFSEYKDGDILQCKRDYNISRINVEQFEHPFINDCEYVVLEGYKPTPVKEQPKSTEPVTTYRGKQYREVKRKANVGELVKIVKAFCSYEKYRNGDILTCRCDFDSNSIHVSEFKYPCVCYSEYVTLEPIAPVKRTYTAEQIREAKDIVYGLMTQHIAHHNGWSCSAELMFFIDKNKGIVTCSNPQLHQKQLWAKCSENDEWNEHIGRMVTICKMFNEPLPKWVKGESK